MYAQVNPLHALLMEPSKQICEIDAILCYPCFGNEETDPEKGIDLPKVALWQSQLSIFSDSIFLPFSHAATHIL